MSTQGLYFQDQQSIRGASHNYGNGWPTVAQQSGCALASSGAGHAVFQNTVILKEIELRYDELFNVRPFKLLIARFVSQFVSDL